ncbi:LexA family protein [Rothia nasimurium]|uniref:LexA family protein n=1 Tax=Rothia nasimurium TaxID=85336 RepID=UPI001F00317F|nr:translesion error-prone DNA polymerase V autoproteolytic subunit [Rothia nasimurium]
MKASLVARLPANYKPYLFPLPEIRIPAGFPSPAQDYQATSIDLNDILIQDRAATYILRVSGSSMIDAGIADGDEIIVDRSVEPRSGSVVVASIDGEFTVKRFHIDAQGQGWLLPENNDYAPIPIPAESDFVIFGVVTRCLHRV